MAVANRFDRRNDYGDMTWDQHEALMRLAEDIVLKEPAEGHKFCRGCGAECEKSTMVREDVEWICAECAKFPPAI